MPACPVCKEENIATARFCTSCGTNLTGDVSSAEPSQDFELFRAHLEAKDIILDRRLDDGEGGFADVYVGSQPGVRDRVAIKLLKAEMARNTEIRKRFLKEAKTAANLRHPNVVDVFLVGMLEERPYFVMEFAPGGSLKTLLVQRGKLTFKEAAEYVIPVLNGLGTAHKQGIIHRDIKPDNILLRDNGEPFVTDFGIARGPSGGTAVTQTGVAMGTAHYMAPEQWQGLSQTDSRSDIYSVGIMLFQLLTGSVPFDATSHAALGYKHVHEPIPGIGNLPGMSSLPPAVQGIIEKACAKDPAHRYQTADEMVAAMNAALAPSTRLSQATAILPGTQRSAAPKQKSRLPLILGGIAIASVLLLGLGLAAIAALYLTSKSGVPVQFSASPVEIASLHWSDTTPEVADPADDSTDEGQIATGFEEIEIDGGKALLPEGAYTLRVSPPEDMGLEAIQLEATVVADKATLVRPDGKVVDSTDLSFPCREGIWNEGQQKCVVPPRPQGRPAGHIAFGDNGGQYANDLECDDPRFTSTGNHTYSDEAHRCHDASDCRRAYLRWEVSLSGQAACASSSDGNSSTPAGGQSFTIQNSTGLTIFYVYASPVNNSSWGEDRLGSTQTIAPGASVQVTMSEVPRGQCMVDIRVVDNQEGAYERRNVNVCTSRFISLGTAQRVQ